MVHSRSLALRTRIPRLRSKSNANSQKSCTQCRSDSEFEAGIKEQKTMKRKHLFQAIAVLLAAGGLWLARSAWRTHPSHKPSVDVGFKTPDGANFDPKSAASLPRASQTGSAAGPNDGPKPGQMPQPPIPNRRFTDFTPEERVKFARQGHGPGG
jgi:hypothetical protein